MLRAAVPVALLSLAACAGTAPPAADATSPPPSSSSAPPTVPEGTHLEISYRGGQITGDGGRVPVPLGDTVTLQVTSDVADEVHVHGYDLAAEVAPGAPATVTFDATVPGVFEVELEHLGQELLTLQVQ